jgi:hypothetical protein
MHDGTEKIISSSYINIITDKKLYNIHPNHSEMKLLLENSIIQCFDEKGIIKEFTDSKGILLIYHDKIISIS